MARKLPTPVWVRTGSGLDPRWRRSTLMEWELRRGRWFGRVEGGGLSSWYDQADLTPAENTDHGFDAGAS